MSWKLIRKESACGEQPGTPSKIGFRGTRFSISKTGKLYLSDYSGEFTFADVSICSIFIKQVKQVMGANWAGRIRIRANGDTYAIGPPSTYVGNLDRGGDDEPFSGYSLGKIPPPPPPGTAGLRIYTGPHNHGHVGERWTIAPDSFGRRTGNIGNVGLKYERGDWVWSESDHSHFISTMRALFPFEDYIRFYITNFGYVVRPVKRKYWGHLGIQWTSAALQNAVKCAPKSMQSVQERLNRSLMDDGEMNDSTAYFVCGHIDQLMGGEIPIPDLDDPRTNEINQEKKKWG